MAAKPDRRAMTTESVTSANWLNVSAVWRARFRRRYSELRWLRHRRLLRTIAVLTASDCRSLERIVVTPTSILIYLVVEAGTGSALLAPFAAVAIHRAREPTHE